MVAVCGVLRFSGLTGGDQEAVRHMVAYSCRGGMGKQDIFSDRWLAMGHGNTLRTAPQSVCSTDERFVLVFNGELYNCRELKRELGHSESILCANSDTEVLLELFAARGKACLPLLNGAFALALWDRREQQLTLARDRFGQKPLFYALHNGLFLFASEVQALFEHPELERRVNLNAIYHYLTIQSVPAPLTAFQQISKLPPAHCLDIDIAGRVKLAHYWTPGQTLFTGSEQEAEEELDYRLRRTIARHLDSELPTGLFLSGGVDSSLITAIACRERVGMQSFSMGFAEVDHDERPFAAQAAKHCGSVHAAACAGFEVADILPEMVRHYGEPFADSSALPTWLLCQMARQHVTVALCGDGGDDLFGGYERYLNPFLYARDVPQDIMRQHQELIQELRLANLSSAGLTPAMSKYYFHLARFCGEHKRRLCTLELCEAAEPVLSLQIMLDYLRRYERLPPLDVIQRFELDYYLGSTLTVKMEVASRTAGITVRAPLLDNEVAAFAFSLPASLKVRALPEATGGSFGKGFEAKWLLKKVSCRYLPHELVYRRKMGFGVPLASWLRGPLKTFMHDTLSASSPVYDWVDQSEVQQMMREHEAGTRNHEYRLWAVLILIMWYKVLYSL